VRVLRGEDDFVPAARLPGADVAREAPADRGDADFEVSPGDAESPDGVVASAVAVIAGADESTSIADGLLPVEPVSVKGVPTRPAAPKPTPTDAAAKTAHRATSAKRLFTPPSVPGRG
jgi:hypothetical protein